MPALAGRRNVVALAAVALVVLPAVANPYLLYVTNIALIYVILAVGLNLLLIPAYGIIGAAIGTYAAMLGGNLVLYWLVRKRLGIDACVFPLAGR